MRNLSPEDWTSVDEGIKDAMRRIENLSAQGEVLAEREGANLWRVLDALNHARAVLHDGMQLCGHRG